MNDELSAVSSAALRSYLVSRGWQRDGAWRGAGVWSQHQQRLLVPENTEYADYDEVLRVAIRRLAETENRHIGDIVLDIRDPDVDVPSFRLHPGSASGTIPLPLALKAIQGIHDLLKVSAQTLELGSRLHYMGRPSKYVDHFLQQVRIGTTRPGSYVFDARVPMSAAGEPTLDPSMSAELRGRAVVSVLYQAAGAIHSAAEQAVQHDTYDQFIESVPVGVSANLCTALVLLGGGVRNCTPFDVDFTGVRDIEADLTPGSLRFDSTMIRTVRTAATVLEQVSKSGRAVVTGLVDWLTTSGEEPRVRIRGELETAAGTAEPENAAAQEVSTQTGESGRSVTVGTVWVALSSGQYQQALDAHRDNRRLEVRGNLIPGSPRLQIAPDRDGFRVL
ncbi:hypothetical protein [Nocardia wallacei]|uniref:hypothetical protein n=1 Tax=Nocardia wallacei TaxID=480035 RepID=UPI002457F573|nr:hypothetical protein [Nocardia wallacei]